MNQLFRDVNQAYVALMYEANSGDVLWSWEETRNGRALVRQLPALYTHANPGRRVLFDPVRNANPFFHYMESIWMLAGENTVNFPSRFAENIKNYSDDGVVFHGAYGYRWRKHFQLIPNRDWLSGGVNPCDQIDMIVKMLKRDPSSRRVVLGMWDPAIDLGKESKDFPCNTHIYVRIQNEALDITVCNRSNDLVWGMLGANFVHFTILQEYLAGALGVEIGKYHHFTNNLHIYEGWEKKVHPIADTWYDDHEVFLRLRFSPTTLPLDQASLFINDPEAPLLKNTILSLNARPMYEAWKAYKNQDLDLAEAWAASIHDDDWRYACLSWLGRKG